MSELVSEFLACTAGAFTDIGIILTIIIGIEQVTLRKLDCLS